MCKKLGIHQQTYYKWRREYGGLRMDQAKRLKELEKRLLFHQAAQFSGLQSPGTGCEAVLLGCFRSAPTVEQNSHENYRTLSRVSGVIRGAGQDDTFSHCFYT